MLRKILRENIEHNIVNCVTLLTKNLNMIECNYKVVAMKGLYI